METSSKVAARFLLKKEIYDDGESIDFFNTSENAKKFFWEFGDDHISTEHSPIFTASLNSEKFKKISITLHAYGENGHIDTFEKSVLVCKRILSDFSITQISEQIRSKITEVEGRDTLLLVFFGPVSEVRGWSPESHRLPVRFFSKLTQMPFRFNLEKRTTTVMSNEEWYLRISSQVNDSSTPIFLNEFRFFPPKQRAIKINEHQNKFILKDELMEVEVDFFWANH